MTDKKREAFEKWHNQRYSWPPKLSESGEYYDGFTRDHWESWQAAWDAAQATPLKESE